MRRHRSSAPPPESSSSDDDDEDAFSAFSNSKKNKRKQKKKSKANLAATTKKNQSAESEEKPKHASTSGSIRRHHGTSSARQAKMDAMLLDLEKEKEHATSTSAANNNANATGPGHYGPSSYNSRPPPDKKGSFVEEGDELLTTNIFVGNLAPSVTEEALTDLFRQFGDLYSVKIMWPRTAEERARNRNTGFVCFMTRDDAQEAMDAFNEEEVFGRRMILRWGKNVKKTVKRGTGGVPIPPIKKKTNKKHHDDFMAMEDDPIVSKTSTKILTNTNDEQNYHSVPSDSLSSSIDLGENGHTMINSPKVRTNSMSACTTLQYPIYDPTKDGKSAIKVIPPSDTYRLQFISTVASFVAKDGSLLEKKLIAKESSNPVFGFLDNSIKNITTNMSNTEKIQYQERVFYRWRVFAFNQGDGWNSWRTDPFVMFLPHGQWWIPPPLNHEAALREEELAKRREDDIIKKMEERRRISNKKDFMTGRQLEHAKFGNVPRTKNEGGGVQLNKWEKEQLNALLNEKLCASRESICLAMSFCFDKSGAAVEIANVLKNSLLEDGLHISVDTRIARLYLLSDVLFNSQQPGIRNAFRYRDAIEAMAPEVFTSMGKHGNGKAGRMTMNKLRQAINSVLNAWTNWSVYNSVFIDELQMRFEGKEIIKKAEEPTESETVNPPEQSSEEQILEDINVKNPPIKRQRVDWKPVDDKEQLTDVDGEQLDENDIINSDCDKKDHNEKHDTLIEYSDVDGEALEDDDFDGEPLIDEEIELMGQMINVKN